MNPRATHCGYAYRDLYSHITPRVRAELRDGLHRSGKRRSTNERGSANARLLPY